MKNLIAIGVMALLPSILFADDPNQSGLAIEYRFGHRDGGLTIGLYTESNGKMHVQDLLVRNSDRLNFSVRDYYRDHTAWAVLTTGLLIWGAYELTHDEDKVRRGADTDI